MPTLVEDTTLESHHVTKVVFPTCDVCLCQERWNCSSKLICCAWHNCHLNRCQRNIYECLIHCACFSPALCAQHHILHVSRGIQLVLHINKCIDIRVSWLSSTETVNPSDRSAVEQGTARRSQMEGLPLHGAGTSFASLVCIRVTQKRTVRRARSR